MQIPRHVIERLKLSWGDKASALDCYAEVRLYDPMSSWECYLFAMDAQEETVSCLLVSNMCRVDISTVSILTLASMYNSEGEPPLVDTHFRRRSILSILKRYKSDT